MERLITTGISFDTLSFVDERLVSVYKDIREYLISNHVLNEVDRNLTVISDVSNLNGDSFFITYVKDSVKIYVSMERFDLHLIIHAYSSNPDGVGHFIESLVFTLATSFLSGEREDYLTVGLGIDPHRFIVAESTEVFNRGSKNILNAALNALTKNVVDGERIDQVEWENLWELTDANLEGCPIIDRPGTTVPMERDHAELHSEGIPDNYPDIAYVHRLMRYAGVFKHDIHTDNLCLMVGENAEDLSERMNLYLNSVVSGDTKSLFYSPKRGGDTLRINNPNAKLETINAAVKANEDGLLGALYKGDEAHNYTNYFVFIDNWWCYGEPEEFFELVQCAEELELTLVVTCLVN